MRSSQDLGFEFLPTVLGNKNPAGRRSSAQDRLLAACPMASPSRLDAADEKTLAASPARAFSASRAQVNDWLLMSRRDASESRARAAWSAALKTAAAACRLSLAEFHDCFTSPSCMFLRGDGAGRSRRVSHAYLDDGSAPRNGPPGHVSGGRCKPMASYRRHAS